MHGICGIIPLGVIVSAILLGYHDTAVPGGDELTFEVGVCLALTDWGRCMTITGSLTVPICRFFNSFPTAT